MISNHNLSSPIYFRSALKSVTHWSHTKQEASLDNIEQGQGETLGSGSGVVNVAVARDPDTGRKPRRWSWLQSRHLNSSSSSLNPIHNSKTLTTSSKSSARTLYPSVDPTMGRRTLNHHLVYSDCLSPQEERQQLLADVRAMYEARLRSLNGTSALEIMATEENERWMSIVRRLKMNYDGSFTPLSLWERFWYVNREAVIDSRLKRLRKQTQELVETLVAMDEVGFYCFRYPVSVCLPVFITLNSLQT